LPRGLLKPRSLAAPLKLRPFEAPLKLRPLEAPLKLRQPPEEAPRDTPPIRVLPPKRLATA